MLLKRARPLLVFFALVLAFGSVSVAHADHETDPALDHIVVDTPATFGQCIDAVTSSTISITNVQDPVTGDPWFLRGQISVEYVTEDGGRLPVPGGLYEIDQEGDLVDFVIEYPPVSEWYVFIDPSTGNTVAEIHVDVQIEVFDQNGIKLGIIGIGPGHDWDVFCLTPPPPPPPGEDGCTPGYWKQSQHFDSWVGFTTDQTNESVFDVPNSLGLDNDTLLTSLSYGGGPGEVGAAKILLRAAVAAVLNASNPDVEYPDTTASVIAQVNAALASLDRDTMIELAGELDAQNNLGCPIS